MRTTLQRSSSQSDDQHVPKGRGRRGNCYVSTEALFHLLGGRDAGWKAMHLRTQDDTHWFLQHESGLILDATSKQFGKVPPDYQKGIGSGFLTKGPSRRAKELMERMLWQEN